MPGTIEYTCRHCGFKHGDAEIVVKDFCLGPHASAPNDPKAYREWEREHLLWLETNTKTYYCDPCWLRLTIPLIIAAADWQRWKESSVKGYDRFADYPFLVGLVARIDDFLKKNPEAPIDIAPIGCPYCGIALSAKEDFSPKCPQCGVSDMKFTGGGIASMRGKWPPVV
jgi:hypothetical protein